MAGLTPEAARSVSRRLRRLATLDALAESGIEDLLRLTQATCKTIEQADQGRSEGSPLIVITSSAKVWTVMFSGHILIDFQCAVGGTASADIVLARCDLSSYTKTGQAEPAGTLEFVKMNGHGQWQKQTANIDDPRAVDERLIAELIGSAVDEALRVYPAKARAE